MASLPERLLLVDDDPMLLGAVARRLGREGFEVMSAGSCAEARRLAGTFPVGVFDLSLGDGNGAALAAELLEAGTVKRAVFHTGSGSCPDAVRAAEIGVVVEKGNPLDVLVEAVAGRAPRSGVLERQGTTTAGEYKAVKGWSG